MQIVFLRSWGYKFWKIANPKTLMSHSHRIQSPTPTALPSLNSDLGLACRRLQKCPCAKQTSESTVLHVLAKSGRHNARCFQSCDSYIMVRILCWPAHCCSTPASRAWEHVADVNNSFSRNFSRVGLSPETTFAFFRRRKKTTLAGTIHYNLSTKCLIAK